MRLKCIVLVFIVIIGIINAAPVDTDNVELKLLNENDTDNPQDSYRYHYDLEDGQKQLQRGYFKYVDAERPKVWVVEGFYSFIAPDGKTYMVTYIADENGYRPNVAAYYFMQLGLEKPVELIPPPEIGSLSFSNHFLSALG